VTWIPANSLSCMRTASAVLLERPILFERRIFTINLKRLKKKKCHRIRVPCFRNVFKKVFLLFDKINKKKLVDFCLAADAGGRESFSDLRNIFSKSDMYCEETLLFSGGVMGKTFYFVKKTLTKFEKLKMLQHFLCEKCTIFTRPLHKTFLSEDGIISCGQY
jgi:hypothetical protein